MVSLRAPRGMNDIFADELKLWHMIESQIHQVSHVFGFDEIRTPILEDLGVFKRGIGEGTDIVEKEMFIINDGDTNYCLRPENTASVVRALIERGGISLDTQEKLFYLGPMFRKERPQKGRLRQFHQFGFESFGVAEPIADIEIILMVDQLFKQLNLTGVELKINSLGLDNERIIYRDLLRKFFHEHQKLLCDDCQRRLSLNPLRVLDCKNPRCHELCANAPSSIANLGSESRTHFDTVCLGLTKNNIKFELDNKLVRGLDYYQRTVFEFVATTGLGAQNAIAAGGRYDGLFTTLGNKIDLPAIGCAGGIERVAMLISSTENKSKQNITLVSADVNGHEQVASLAFKLRALGIPADFSLTHKSVKAQLRRADKLKSSYVSVIGESEIAQQKILIKSMSNEQNWTANLDAQQITNLLKNL